MKLIDKIEKFVSETAEENPLWALAAFLTAAGMIFSVIAAFRVMFVVFGPAVGFSVLFGIPMIAVVIRILLEKED